MCYCIKEHQWPSALQPSSGCVHHSIATFVRKDMPCSAVGESPETAEEKWPKCKASLASISDLWAGYQMSQPLPYMLVTWLAIGQTGVTTAPTLMATAGFQTVNLQQTRWPSCVKTQREGWRRLTGPRSCLWHCLDARTTHEASGNCPRQAHSELHNGDA